jgi:hypothetical protein
MYQYQPNETSIKHCSLRRNHFIHVNKDRSITKKNQIEKKSLFGCGVLGGTSELLLAVDVVLLGELQVPQELGIHLKQITSHVKSLKISHCLGCMPHHSYDDHFPTHNTT